MATNGPAGCEASKDSIVSIKLHSSSNAGQQVAGRLESSPRAAPWRSCPAEATGTGRFSGQLVRPSHLKDGPQSNSFSII